MIVRKLTDKTKVRKLGVQFSNYTLLSYLMKKKGRQKEKVKTKETVAEEDIGENASG